MRLLRFGNYAFPPQTDGLLAFGDVTPRVVKLLGFDGGFDLDGDGLAQASVGNVRASFIVYGDTPAELRAEVDAVYEMLSWGVQRLLVDTDPVRWTWARVNNIRGDEKVDHRPLERQRLTVDFQVATPRWYSRAGVTYDSQGDPVTSPPPQIDSIPVQNGDVVTVTNNGNAHAVPVFALTANSVAWNIGDDHDLGDVGLKIGGLGYAFDGAKLQRRNAAGNVIERVEYSNLVTAPGSLTIDVTDYSVAVTNHPFNIPEYHYFEALTGSWLSLPPGETTIEVVCDPADLFSLTIFFWDTWSS